MLIIVGFSMAVLIGLFGIFLVMYQKQIRSIKPMLQAKELALQAELAKTSQLSKELEALKQHIQQTIMHDPATGLPGPHIFEDRLDQVLALSQRHQLMFGVLFLEIQELKIISNVYGREASELLMTDIVTRIESCMRKVDTLSRFTQNQFVILLPQLVKPEAPVYISQRIFELLASPFIIQDQEVFVSASIGIATYPTDGKDKAELLNNADIAMQQAKLSGRNLCQFYRQEMQSMSKRELILNSSLRCDTIYNEFTIEYQPQIDVEQHSIMGMEALLRWNHPDLGLVAPLEFLQLAENNGRILLIGEWVLRTACLQFKQWQTMGLPVASIAVNVSMRQLESAQFSFKVSQILQETKVDALALILEVSEGHLAPQLDRVSKSLYMLKHLGVRIAIDNFGTGNVAFHHLRRFPIDMIKIDGSLVRDIQDVESEAIIKAIIALAHTLNITVVAEGVETDAEKMALLRDRCTLMQGFLWSKPLSPDNITASVIQSLLGS